MNIFKRLVFAMGIVSLIITILSVVLFLIIKHLKIKDLVESQLESTLGVQVSIGKLFYSPLLSQIGAKDVTVHNPPGFREDVMAYIPSISFVFDPIDMIILKKPNIYLFTINLDKLNIIKNEKGQANIASLGSAGSSVSPHNDAIPFYFDVVVLSIGEVNYTEYSSSGKKTHKYTIGLVNRAFLNLSDGKQVMRLIIGKAIENTDIGKLINLTFVPVVSPVYNTVNSAWGTIKTGTKSAGEIVAFPFKLIFKK